MNIVMKSKFIPVKYVVDKPIFIWLSDWQTQTFPGTEYLH